MNYPYSLEKKKHSFRPYKFTCPECNHPKVFTRYIDNITGDYVCELVGRCDREINCGYHYPPRVYFKDNKILIYRGESSASTTTITGSPLQHSVIDKKHVSTSMRRYDQNNLAIFLKRNIPESLINDLLLRYKVGTSYRWPGSTVFWQMNGCDEVRAGKIIQYDRNTGRRIKYPQNHIDWVHNHFGLKNFNLEQCLFGEHLISNDKRKTIGVVESEKTAIIASAYLPNYIWVATGSIGNLNKRVCKALSDRNVVLFPDGDGYNKWQQKAVDLREIAEVEVSDILESKLNPEEKYQGIDLADFLLRFEFPD